MIHREVIWHVLQMKRVYKRYVDAIRDIYDGVVTSIKTIGEKVIRSQLQASYLMVCFEPISNPFSYQMILLDTFTMGSDDICYLYQDIVESYKLELWREVLKSKGFKVSRTN